MSSIANLSSYLQEIAAGRGINLSEFMTLINKLSLDIEVYPSDIQSIKIGKRHLITKINPNLLRELQRLSITAMSTRCGAASQNKSHSVKVAGSLLLLRKAIAHPEVVLFDATGDFTRLSKPTKQLLAIENRQNFLDSYASLAFLKANTPLPLTDDIDIVFADGNQISNSLHKRFLMDYETIYAFLDLDLGGLQIASKILSLIGEGKDSPSFHFILPNNVDKLLSEVVEIRSMDYLNKIEEIASQAGSLNKPAAKILFHRKTLEQEAFLYE